MEPSDSQFDFGFQEVSADAKKARVNSVFERVADRYDLMNDLMSLGAHRVWKERFVAALPLFQKGHYLDVAGGTGDIGAAIQRRLRKISAEAQVTVCDINPSMISKGKTRFPDLFWVCGSAESLPFPDESVDVYTIAFGLRNVTHRDKAIQEAYRVLRPGGHFACLEFSQPFFPLRKAYDLYSFHILPRLGAVIARDKEAYQYLVESIRTFLTREELLQLMKGSGLTSLSCETLTGGIVAMHRGYKPF